MFRPILFALLPVVTGALSASSAAAELRVRFLAERFPAELGKVVMETDEERSDEFDVPTKYLSDPLVAPAREFRVRMTRRNTTLAKVSLPDEGGAFVILLIPSREGGFQPVPIPADRTNFRAGAVYFYNHSPHMVFGHVGSSKFRIEPSTGLAHQPAGARGGNYYDVAFYFRSPQGDRPLSRTRWPADDKVRTFAFFYIHPESGRLAFRTVDEFLPSPGSPDSP